MAALSSNNRKMTLQAKTLLLIMAFNLLNAASANDALNQAFESFKIVPNIISTPPTNLMEVSYGNITVNTGTKITAEESQKKPCVKWPMEPNSLYTLIMIDPDIPPAIPTDEIIHWLVVNIPEDDISKGITLFEYIGGTPPKDDPAHRYIFLLYKQDEALLSENYSSFTDEKQGKLSLRMKIQLKDVVSQLHLKNLTAGNFHTTIFDENVPRLWNATLEKYN